MPFLRRLSQAALLSAFTVGSPLSAQSVEEGRESALDHAMALEELVAGMSMELWDYSEIALQESRSAAYLSGILEDEGFTVERGAAGMPTAFVASWGSGTPILGVLAEYDALPNIGNAARPERSPRDDEHITVTGAGTTSSAPPPSPVPSPSSA
jgi:aminobenzoyl-glutamate utilization protein B